MSKRKREKTDSEGLTERQRAFIAFYCGDAKYNATKAAEMAGYAVPRQSGSEQLSNPVIRAAIENHLAELRGESLRSREGRIARLEAIAEKIEHVFAERAKEYAELEAENAGKANLGGLTPSLFGRREVPAGGTSGLLTRQIKVIGSGRSQTIAEEFAMDTGAIREYRATLEQVAKEVGESIDKVSVTGKDEGPIELASVGDARDALARAIAQAIGARDAGSSDREPQPSAS